MINLQLLLEKHFKLLYPFDVVAFEVQLSHTVCNNVIVIQ